MKYKTLIGLLFIFLLNSCNSEVSSVISSSSIASSEEQSLINESSSDLEPAVYYDGYYSSLVSWENGEDLKEQLHNIISGGSYKALPYTNPNYESNIYADHTKYDFEELDVLYSEYNVPASKTNVGWQREHCFPASLMTGTTTGNASKVLGRATDFHNLFACSGGANSARGNRNYGIPSTTSENYVNRKSEDGKEGYACDEINFEPGDKDKGLVARAIFYMATMYIDEQKDTTNNVTMKGLSVVEDPVSYIEGDNCRFAIGGLSTLLEWNKFSVSEIEAQHNQSVYEHVLSFCNYAQGNRNPYVDYPELVDYVFGAKKNTAGSLSELTPSIKSLNRYTDKISNYAILTAKREYNYGDTLLNTDYKIVQVANNFTYSVITTAYSKYDNYKFSGSDGLSKTIVINIGEDKLSYNVNLIPSGECNTKVAVTKDGIDKTKVNVDQEVTFGGLKWIVNIDSTSGFTLTNDNQRGGIKIGSGTKPLNGIKITSVNSYKINAIFIEAFSANKSSTYDLTIKVGDTKVRDRLGVSYNSAEYSTYGTKLNEPLEGKIMFEFNGSNSIQLRNISFNVVE